MDTLDTKEFVSYNWPKFTEVILSWFNLADEWQCVTVGVNDAYIISKLLNGISNVNSEIGVSSLTQNKGIKEYVYTYKDKGYKVLLDTIQRMIKIKKIN